MNDNGQEQGLRPYNAHAATALRLKASDPRWAQVNELAEARARLINPQCWFNLKHWQPGDPDTAEERAGATERERQEHNLLDPLARSEGPTADEVSLN